MKKYSAKDKTSALLETFVRAAVISVLLSVKICHAGEAESPGGPVFPNDFGPTRIDVSGYPERIQAEYPVFVQRCSQCHTIARAISSQYLQLTPKQQKAAHEREPEIFQDDRIWHINDSVWSGYVQHMHEKPGASLRHYPADIDQITEFLIYDSRARKTGSRRESWRAGRQKLLDDFKKSDPKRSAELFGP